MTSPTVLFSLGLAISLGYLWMTNRPESWLRSTVKTLPMALFAFGAYCAGAPAFLTLALIFSAVGDLALSREGRKTFLFGLAGFAIAHLMFILLFQSLGSAQIWESFVIHPIAAILLLAASLSSEIWLAPFTGPLKGPVRVYVTLITIMGLAALALPAGYSLVALGAGLFILSDMILSLRLFRLGAGDPRRMPAAWALWVFYIAGQALIVIGIAPL